MKEKEKDENKVKFSEKISLNLRKKWLVNGTKTFLIVAILVAGYMALNLGLNEVDLPKIDVTENKIYTLSDASKDAIRKVDQEIKLYAYGFDEQSNLIGLLKQYAKVNDKISYEILTEESNYEMVKKYNLSEGYYSVILKSGETEKVVSSQEFTTYDYTTYEKIDTTEQVMTNSIIALTDENKPKVYFVEGHSEFSLNELQVLNGYLGNEAFEVETLNITSKGSIPEDCDVLAIMSPNKDFFEAEVTAIKEYINRGGNIYMSMDTMSEGVSLPNIQAVLDEYGVSIENGYILEMKSNQSVGQYPYIFRPQVSYSHKITADISTDSYMWLMYSARLQYKSDDELEKLKVEKENLLSTSDEAKFVTDLSLDINSAKASAEAGTSEISAILTKNVGAETQDQGEENTEQNGQENTSENSNKLESKLVIVATGNFITDYTSPLSESYPLSAIGSNKDFVINSMAYLGEKGNSLTIRKDMASSTYQPTDVQNIIVTTIVFAVPVIIIFIGIVVWSLRKRRK